MAPTRLTNGSGYGGSPHFYRSDSNRLIVQGYHAAPEGITPPQGEGLVEVPAVLAIDAICALTGEVTRTDLDRMLRLISKSSFRLEARQSYLEPAEEPVRQHFRTTGQILLADPALRSWQQMVADHLAQGRTMRRVHLVRAPLSDYLRFEFALQAHTGEDVRIVNLHEHPELAGAPPDYWLFDDRVALRMLYNHEGRLLDCMQLGQDHLDDCRAWRDRTWQAATPLAPFLEQHRTA